ncbi:hypothetical protein G7068_01635 [Leucobacter viscericola]|uniref:Sap, sulfolipid-1-addressing protein n=1 Tax=Leucobacter viscericola TaxID=2714935 RepID=A0A6G7XBR8_9MICO|nr:GAP family protein [Leucobacter viscericola]QIK62050.1 hypothetical protein G7068_01635 [Leucobacter viscericola]
MGELLITLLPLGLGIIMSPLAIMALVAVLVSQNARRNGIAFLLGWITAIVLIMLLCFWIFSSLTPGDRGPAATWVSVLRLIVGVFLVLSAVYMWLRGRHQIREMAAAVSPTDVVEAAPQLPGWLRAVDKFNPGRSYLLGIGIFVLNPVDLSCAVIATLDIHLAQLDFGPTLVTSLIFGLVAASPILIPVIIVLVKGKGADGFLQGARTWIAGNTNILNGILLAIIGFMQLSKAIQDLLA